MLTLAPPAKSPSARSAAAILLGLSILACCGCQTLNVKAPFPWDRDKADKSPDKIMAVWTDAVKTEPGKPGERGFGGRVFFYDDQGKTMKAKGEVSIYLFDDDRSLDEAQVPEKKYVFPADTLELRYSKCSLGHSYNFWVPVGPVNGPNRKLSLVTKIELEQGGSVVSGVTRKILPGSGYNPPPGKPAAETALSPPSATNRKSENRAASTTGTPPNEGVAQASYTEPISPLSQPAAAHSRSISAETIQLTPSFTERLRKVTEDSDTNKDSRGKEAPKAPALKSGPAVIPTANSGLPPNQATSPERTPDSPATHSEPSKSQAQNQPSMLPNATHPRYQPHPAGWLSSLPPTPRSGFQSARPKIERSALQRSRQAVATLQAQAESQALAAGSGAYSDGVVELGD
jgi:hypothetical protein